MKNAVEKYFSLQRLNLPQILPKWKTIDPCQGSRRMKIEKSRNDCANERYGGGEIGGLSAGSCLCLNVDKVLPQSSLARRRIDLLLLRLLHPWRSSILSVVPFLFVNFLMPNAHFDTIFIGLDQNWIIAILIRRRVIGDARRLD